MDMMQEIQLWKERKAAFDAGQPWYTTTVYEYKGYVRDETTGRELVNAGLIRYCNQCSSPRQDIYHDKRS